MNGLRVYCLDLEIRYNILPLLHALKDLRALLFYMLCAVFQRILLNIFVMILLTLSAICVFCFILSFMLSVFIYPPSAADIINECV